MIVEFGEKYKVYFEHVNRCHPDGKPIKRHRRYTRCSIVRLSDNAVISSAIQEVPRHGNYNRALGRKNAFERAIMQSPFFWEGRATFWKHFREYCTIPGPNLQGRIWAK